MRGRQGRRGRGVRRGWRGERWGVEVTTSRGGRRWQLLPAAAASQQWSTPSGGPPQIGAAKALGIDHCCGAVRHGGGWDGEGSGRGERKRTRETRGRRWAGCCCAPPLARGRRPRGLPPAPWPAGMCGTRVAAPASSRQGRETGGGGREGGNGKAGEPRPKTIGGATVPRGRRSHRHSAPPRVQPRRPTVRVDPFQAKRRRSSTTWWRQSPTAPASKPSPIDDEGLTSGSGPHFRPLAASDDDVRKAGLVRAGSAAPSADMLRRSRLVADIRRGLSSPGSRTS